MSLATFLSWMVCGLIVGVIARILMPSWRRMGLLLTIVLGIVGAIVGGYLYSLAVGAPSEPLPLSFSGTAWHGWIVAVLGAMLVLWVFMALNSRKRWWQ